MEQRLGTDVFLPLLRIHNQVLNDAFVAVGGVVVKTEGDAFFVGFPRASSAVGAAVAAQRALFEVDWPAGVRIRVRMGLHTGEARVVEGAHAGTEDYAGIDVNLAARIAAAANGGQILLSETTDALCGVEVGEGISKVVHEAVRLKDFDQPRTLVQVVVSGAADDTRRLRAAEAPNNLPTQLTTFVGRQAELNESMRLLADTRLLTLTGPGGTGKTRLAISFGESVRDDYPDGVWFVPLAAVRDPLLVPSAIGIALGITEEPDTPILERIVAQLTGQAALLIVDNFEQVVPASSVVAYLLTGAPRIKVVVTSREILRITGEQEYGVPTLSEMDAGFLFAERARRVDPNFAMGEANLADIAAICERLDNIPLAIELASARIRMFTAGELRRRLDRSLDLLTGGGRERDDRQRTLRGAIAWSYELLSEAERRLFRRLAVLVGGWTLDAAEAVAGPELSHEVLEGLASLIDKSLLYTEVVDDGTTRFRRLVTMREFALEQLEQSGELHECGRRHAEYFAGVARSAQPDLEWGDPSAWVGRLEFDLHNLRSALAWSLQGDGDIEIGLDLAANVWRFWMHRPRLSEGRDWCSRLLADSRAERFPDRRFWVLTALGGLAYWQRDYAKARSIYVESLSIAEAADDQRMTAEALYNLGFLDMVDQNLEDLRARHEAAASMFVELGDEPGIAKARQGLVLLALLHADYASARKLGLDVLVHLRVLGNHFRVADSLVLLSAVEAQLGEFKEAWDHLAESLYIYRQRGLEVGLIGGMQMAAILAAMAGTPEEAGLLVGASETMRERAEGSNAPLEVLHLPDPGELVRAAVGEDRFKMLYEEGRLMSIDQAFDVVLRLAREPSEVMTSPDHS